MANKITKCQQDYIANNWEIMSAETIAEDTGLAVTTIKKHIKSLQEAQPATQIVTEDDKKEEKRSRKNTMFMNAIGKNNIALVMTEGGAQMGDDFKQNKKKKNKLNSHIHKPLGD